MDAGCKKEQNPNPRLTANILSLITFSWIQDIFKKGYKKELEIEDLYDALDEHRSGNLGDELERLWNLELERSKVRGKQPSLLRILLQRHWKCALFLQFVQGLIEFCFITTQPLFLGGLLRYYEPGSEMSYDSAVVYAFCIIACSILQLFMSHANVFAIYHIGMKMRVGICSLVYRKTLKLSKTALGKTTVGQAVNLLSNDVNRFDRVLLFTPFIWIGPLQMIVLVYLVWQLIGISSLAGVAIVVLLAPFQILCGKLAAKLRARTAKRTDERIRLMNEIITGIQVIKMYAWEKPFTHLVSLTRKREIQSIRARSFMQGFMFTFGWFIGCKGTIFASIVTYALLGNSITPEKMFVPAAFFQIMAASVVDSVSYAITVAAEANVSIKRLQTFLLHDEVTVLTNSENHVISDDEITKKKKERIANGSVEVNPTLEKSSSQMHGDIGDMKLEADLIKIKISDVTTKWTEDLTENTLKDIKMNVRLGELVAIIGPVGSGKTSLLHAVLKELPLNSGSISVKGSISYASQEPWLFSGPVRQNILFGQPMKKDRYRNVVRVCALERDFQLLPHGDKTLVGERGVTLSGGQKARINLARAIYKEADIYLLDDPLSAVDTHVGRHLFEDCIRDFLRHKTRVLITHQLQYLHTADNIVIINNGSIEAAGTYTQLHESGLDFAKQLTLQSEEEQEEEFDTVSTHSSTRKTSRQVSETSSLMEPEKIVEMQSHGVVSSRVYRNYCAAGGNCGVTLLIAVTFIVTQVVTSSGDYWMSYWANVEEQRSSMIQTAGNDTWDNVTFPISNATAPPFEYNTTNFTSTNYTEWKWLPSTDLCIYVYTGFLVTMVTFTIGSILLFTAISMRASNNLHNAMFANVTRATMFFFNSNPSGQILNRFAKDIGSVDEALPQTMMDCILIGLQLLGVITVVAIVNPWLLIPTAVMFVIFYMLRKYCVSTTRSIKRLEGATRSPVFSHLSASLQGLSTIRAFGAQTLLEKEFDNHQDLHSSAWYTYITTTRAFGVWLDSSCLMYLTLVILSFLFVSGEQSGGNVGLAISQSMGLLGMIQWGMRQTAELENYMTSLERVLQYTSLENEPPLESLPGKKPPGNWPSQGAITFEKVFLSYCKDEVPVLRNINFTVRPSEKVGIVGRTGAGKSSLITALFRLVDMSSGLILIDDVDIISIGLHDLRSQISIIPQEPALFSGTLRDNLDPFEQYSDAALWAALQEVELKQVVDELPAGLSHKVSEGGSNFSVGQRQLLCLARAIVRNNKILVLDEATANVDPQTDELIQATIRRKFADCTVLTIAHRLHTVMDSDRVLVMDAGFVMEFDHPHVLLSNKKSVLHQMVEQTGNAMADSLLKMAKSSYEKKLKQSVENKIATLNFQDSSTGR